MDAAVPLPGSALTDADTGIQTEPPPWFKRRGYPHFDRSLAPKQAIRLVQDPKQIARRSFLPFISFSIKQRRFKRNKEGKREAQIKEREVAFASHADACVFSYYGWLLKQPYEALLTERGLTQCVLAYRRFDPPKCNIHFANEVFAEIERRGNCTAVALDIESFFDTIPHNELKRLWSLVLDETELPDDHYAVFKAVTKWAKADRDSVFDALGIGRTRRENWDRRDALCSPEKFRKKIRGAKLIESGFTVRNGTSVGIPQGSPISALLSNLVMLEADTAIAASAEDHGVYYRRYSDDILLIGESDCVKAVEAEFNQEMDRLGFGVNEGKTKRCRFFVEEDDQLRSSSPLQYLGFTFDGERVLVRPQTIAKFLSRMKHGVRSAKRAAKAAERNGGDGKLRRQELYARYSHLGPTRAMLTRGPKSSLRNNFYGYARRSEKEMNHGEIKRQLRHHWKQLNAEIQLADEN